MIFATDDGFKFYVHPFLGKIPILTQIFFQNGCQSQPTTSIPSEADDPQALLSSDLPRVAVLCGNTQLEHKAFGIGWISAVGGWDMNSSRQIIATCSRRLVTPNDGSVRESSPKKPSLRFGNYSI